MEGDMHDIMHLQWAWSEVNSGGIGSDVMHGGNASSRDVVWHGIMG